jgi:uncharacterized protein YdhG (YjbR/CyaY superfamily)
MAPKNDPGAVEAYLASLPDDERSALQNLRELIKSEVPDARERISYGTTVIFALDKDLVGFVSQPKHLSFFTMSPPLAARLKGEIKATHNVSGATIHFSPDNPLPEALVKKVLAERLQELKPAK